jgi:glycosyltransferase involved in cell wall biosynthesis
MNSKQKLPVSVVVITKNAEKDIGKCLESVKKNNPAEIIVVDGDSTDKTVEIARQFTDIIFSDHGEGKSYARQLGAEQAKQGYIAYVDSDVTLTEGALATMLGDFKKSDFVSINASLEVPPGPGLSYLERGAQFYQAQLGKRHTGLATAACLIKKETVVKYGFELGYGGYIDDYDLELRLRRDGKKFGASSAVAYHKARDTFGSFWECWYVLGRVASYKVRKYGPGHAGFWPPLVTGYWVGRCLIKGKFWVIPYFLALGAAETAGMTRGFFESPTRTKRQGSYQ